MPHNPHKISLCMKNKNKLMMTPMKYSGAVNQGRQTASESVTLLSRLHMT